MSITNNGSTRAYSERDKINNLHGNLLSPQQSSHCEAALKTGNRQTIVMVIAMLVILLASSTRPDQLSFEGRLQSFLGFLDTNEAVLWAEQGFYLDSSNGASCFHCGAHTDKLRQDPVQLHPRLRSDCNLLSLTRFLSAKTPALTHDMIVTGAARFEKLLMNILTAFSGSISKFVQSFGFSIEQVALGLARFFISSDGRQQLRPGDLMELTDSPQSDDVQYLGSRITALLRHFEGCIDYQIAPDSMDDAGAVLRSSETTVTNSNGMNNNAQHVYMTDGGASAIRPHDHQLMTERTELSQEDRDSPLCIQCKMNQKDRVLLPCAHLVLCRVCAQNARRCLVCGEAVACPIAAFIA